MKYNVGVTLPLSLFLPDVEANSPEEAIEKAKQMALYTPYGFWDDDFSKTTAEIIEE